MIPKLRFPEFTDNWTVTELGECSDIQTGKALPSSEILESGDRLICRGINVKSGFLESNSEINRFTNSLIDRKYLVQSDDILLPMDGSKVGKNIAVADLEFHNSFLIQRVARIRLPKELVWFYFQQLWSWNFERYVFTINTSSGIPHISEKQIRRFRVSKPSLEEAQKISSLFELVNKKINLLTKKKEALETYKKGLMQKIFSQEFSNQRLMLLSQICKIYDGTHQTPKYVDEGVPFYSVEHVSKDDFSKTKFITEEVFTKECKRVSIEQGDILMTRIGSVGVPKFIDWDVRASFYVSLALLKPKIEEINMEWLSYYIQSLDIQRDIWRLTIHVAFPKKINLGDIGKIKIKLPSKAVQESNYVLLKSLDQNINLTIKKIKASEELKKGLLQQMFV